LRRKAPSPDKKKVVIEDQEGCGQSSLQTSSDKFEGEENAQENVWSVQAYEHTMLSIVHRMSMKLENKFLDSARIKAETLQKNQRVRNVNNPPTHLRE